MIEYTCQTCGKLFKSDNLFRANKYCSRKCSDIGRTIDKSSICPICHQVFQKRSKMEDRKFCSRSCANKARHIKNKYTYMCEYCHKEFSVDKKRNKEHVYCSKSCSTEQRRSGITTNCNYCGKQIYVPNLQTKWATNFCSPECRVSYLKKYGRNKCSISIICKICGKQFLTEAYQARNGRQYCSRECANIGHRGPQAPRKEHVITYCLKCGKELHDYPSRKGKLFCSKECYKAYHLVTITCEQCNKEFTVLPSMQSRRFCSNRCYLEYNIGPKNGNWRGGRQYYYGPNWNQQKNLVLARDNYTCFSCSSVSKQNSRELSVHHIIPFRVFGIERYKDANSLINLITLCQSCHMTIEVNRQLLSVPWLQELINVFPVESIARN